MREKNAIFDYILKGWLPPQPVIKPTDSILAVGSCFAQHIVSYLRRNKKTKVNEGDQNINLFAFGAGFVNTFTLRQQFFWGLGKEQINNATLFVEDKSKPIGTSGTYAFQFLPADERTRKATEKVIRKTDTFILSLGLSEVWYDKHTEKVFFGAVPNDIYRKDRHDFKVSTVEENLKNISELYQLLRRERPQANIIFTLSPIPLMATFRPVSCVTANSVSKAILRVAVDELMRKVDDKRLFYWPSYEIIKEYFGLDGYMEDRRHPTKEAENVIMQLFEQFYIEGGRKFISTVSAPLQLMPARSPRARRRARAAKRRATQ